MMQPRPSCGRAAAAASGEGLLVAAMVAVILVTVLTAVISWRENGMASEPYAAAMADQRCVFDLLARDLRRAAAPPAMDNDDQGLRIAVPGPGPASAAANRTGTPDPRTSQTVAYRYYNGAITRVDPAQPPVPGSDRPVDTGPVTISLSAEAFPTILADPPADGSGLPRRYRVTFHSMVRPLADTNATREIDLPGSAVPDDTNRTR